MAEMVQTRLVDDLDQGPADGTARFALDGRHYEIDLSHKHRARLGEILAPYIKAGRKAGPGPRSGANQRPSVGRIVDRQDNQKIREWAESQGMKVSDRGRIPAQVLDAYAKHLATPPKMTDDEADRLRREQEDAHAKATPPPGKRKGGTVTPMFSSPSESRGVKGITAAGLPSVGKVVTDKEILLWANVAKGMNRKKVTGPLRAQYLADHPDATLATG